MKYKVFFAALTASVLLGTGVSAMSGQGTKDDPYLIADTDDYMAFAASVNDGTYGTDTYAALVKSLDFTDKTYTVVGTAAHPYTGYFDGCGYTLKGITLTTTDSACYDAINTLYAEGVFGFAENAHIEDLQIEDMTVSLTAKAQTIRAALLCGDYRATSDAADNGIFRCSVTGTLSVKTEQTSYAGGIVAMIETAAEGSYAAISDCKADMTADAAAKFTVYGGAMAAKASELAYQSTLTIRNGVSAVRMEAKTVGGKLSHEYLGGAVGYLSINSDWREKEAASLSAAEPELDACVTTSFKVTPTISSAADGDMVGYYSDSLTLNCYTESENRFTASKYAISGKSVTAEKLKDASFWTGLGYDLTDVWELTENGMFLRKGIESEPDTFTLTAGDNTLTADIIASKLPNGLLVMALYDADGRLTDVKTALIDGETQTLRLTAASENAVDVRFYVLDGTTFAPLAENTVMTA